MGLARALGEKAGVWGSPRLGQTPGPSDPSAQQQLEPSIQKDPVRITHPRWPHPSRQARWAVRPRARQEDAALRRGGSVRGQRPKLRLWVPTSSRAGSGRRPTPGAARRDRFWQTGKPSGLAQPSGRPPPSPAATHHFPSGRQQLFAFPRVPLRMARRPPPFLPGAWQSRPHQATRQRQTGT